MADKLKEFQKKILVVDDDLDTRNLIRDVLQEEGYTVRLCASGEQALECVLEQHFDLILADIRMPGISGMELLKRVREMAADTEVIIVTAFATVESVRKAWQDQAFFYLTKPFVLDELRETVRNAVYGQTPHILCYKDLKIDLQARKVWVGDRDVQLRPKEYGTLAYLFENIGCAVPNHELLREVWGHANPRHRSTDPVKSCVSRLRKKIGDSARDPQYIFNEWSVGYRLGD